MTEIDNLEKKLRRIAGRHLQPIAKEAIIEGKATSEIQIWINALKECVRHRFLTPQEAMWFKERVLDPGYRPQIKKHLYEKLLSDDITPLLGSLSNVQGESESSTGLLEVIYSCGKISRGTTLEEINEICNKCGRRIRDVERIKHNKTPECPILNLPALVDSNIIEPVRGFNPFKYVERYPVDYLDVWGKEMRKRIKEFKKAYNVRPYTNWMHYRDLFAWRTNTSLGRKLLEMRHKAKTLAKKIIAFDKELDEIREWNRKCRKKRKKREFLARIMRFLKRKTGGDGSGSMNKDTSRQYFYK